MTYFEYQKASKTALENQVRKGYAHENRGGFGGGAAWQIRLPHGKLYDMASSRAARHNAAQGMQLRL